MQKSLFDLKREVEDYKKFAFSKNLLNLAITLIMASTIQKVVTSISENLLMPIISYLMSQTGSNWRVWAIHPVNGLTLEVGKLASGLLEFIITTLVLYIFYYKIIKKISPNSEDLVIDKK